jgi:hypothetical protein
MMAASYFVISVTGLSRPCTGKDDKHDDGGDDDHDDDDSLFITLVPTFALARV